MQQAALVLGSCTDLSAQVQNSLRLGSSEVEQASQGLLCWLKGGSKSFQVLFNGVEAVMVLILRIQLGEPKVCACQVSCRSTQ